MVFRQAAKAASRDGKEGIVSSNQAGNARSLGCADFKLQFHYVGLSLATVAAWVLQAPEQKKKVGNHRHMFDRPAVG